MDQRQLDRVKRDRIRAFALNGKFPEDADYYTSATGQLNGNRCVLCGVLSGRSENFTLHQLPQGMYNKVLPKVKVCADCEYTVDHIKAGTVGNPQPEYVLDVCVNCNHNYDITREEYTARSASNTKGMHWCDACLIQKSSSFKGVSRQVAVECETQGCGNDVLIDYTLTPDNQKAVCSTCTKIKGLPQAEVVHFQDNLFIWLKQLDVTKDIWEAQIQIEEGRSMIPMMDCSGKGKFKQLVRCLSDYYEKSPFHQTQ